MNKIINIPQSAKIKVHWGDKGENYSRENKIKVRNDFAKKYGVDKNNVNIIFRPFKVNSKGELIEVKGASIDNIMDISYQRSLMKEWFVREAKSVDLDRLMKLDDKVNNSLNIDLTQKTHRSWNLKWLMLNNFLCYGPKQNFISFANLKGLNVVTSNPSNQGGKCVRANTNIKISYNVDDIVKKLGFLPDELK